MSITSRKSAIDAGLKTYLTGNPCKAGHLSLRRVANRACIECDQKASRDWNKDNPIASARKTSRWQKNNPHKNAEKASRQRAARLGQTPYLTLDEKRRIKHFYYLAHCYSQVEDWDFHVDHIIPIAKGGLHHPENLQILEAITNIKKSDKV